MRRPVCGILVLAVVILLHPGSYGGSSSVYRVCDETQELIDAAYTLCKDSSLTREAKITHFALAMTMVYYRVEQDIANDRTAKETWTALPILGAWLKEGCTQGDFEDHIIKRLGRNCRHLKFPR